MEYLTYDEYTNIGGICDSTAFNRNCMRVFSLIDNATFKRIEAMAQIPVKVKHLCRDMIEYCNANISTGKAVQSASQSSGGTSESESYVVKTADEIRTDLDGMIYDYLASETDDNGTPLLYLGV